MTAVIPVRIGRSKATGLIGHMAGLGWSSDMPNGTYRCSEDWIFIHRDMVTVTFSKEFDTESSRDEGVADVLMLLGQMRMN
jgi:hypothetical protein